MKTLETTRSGSKKQLMLSVAGIEQPKLDALCKEAAAKEALSLAKQMAFEAESGHILCIFYAYSMLISSFFHHVLIIFHDIPSSFAVIRG